MNKSILDPIEQSAVKYSDQTAVLHADQKITYAQLNRMVNAAADFLFIYPVLWGAAAGILLAGLDGFRCFFGRDDDLFYQCVGMDPLYLSCMDDLC